MHLLTFSDVLMALICLCVVLLPGLLGTSDLAYLTEKCDLLQNVLIARITVCLLAKQVHDVEMFL